MLNYRRVCPISILLRLNFPGRWFSTGHHLVGQAPGITSAQPLGRWAHVLQMATEWVAYMPLPLTVLTDGDGEREKSPQKKKKRWEFDNQSIFQIIKIIKNESRQSLVILPNHFFPNVSSLETPLDAPLINSVGTWVPGMAAEDWDPSLQFI